VQAHEAEPRETAEAPGDTRLFPHASGRKALLSPVIPAYPRPARRDHDRPVTPEVAGSSHLRDHTTTSAGPFKPNEPALLPDTDGVNHSRRMCI
jgi:hypothetical protein